MDASADKSSGPITVDAPAGGESLQFRSMMAHDELGRLFTYELELISDDPALKASDLLGQTMTVHLEQRDGELRHWNGYVTDFSLVGSAGKFALYTVTLRPWLWLLTRTTNCRIFQHLSVPDIVRQIFREHGLTDFEERLTGSYDQREYTVQYRESDFNFVSRLLEREGIYYYFKHLEAKHVLVLSDSYSAHDAAPGCESLPYFPPDPQRTSSMEYVDSWQTSHHLEPGAYAHTDFDFERPGANLLAKLSAPNDHAQSSFEIFDYPGSYTQSRRGEDYAKIRLEERHASHATAMGRTNARPLAVGNFFALTDHPVEDLNREYLVVSARHEMRTHDPRSGAEIPDEEVHRCHFSVIESARPFRPACLSQSPIVHGPQTAIVVGKSGEEIWTDDHARVKVKFHWDRFASGDENSSCWVRVSQAWAGSGWGGIHVPRIGQEVIIDFLEGDPDHPIITGRVYNGDNRPPWALPANQTQSGIKSHSTKGGGANNYNAVRFEDKKGSEQVYVQAEKDMDTLVKNDETRLVKHDQTITIENDREKTVMNNETVTVLGFRTETVAKNESISIGGSRAEQVAVTEAITIGGARTTTIGLVDALQVGGAQTVTVGAARAITVVGGEITSIGGARALNLAGNDSINIVGNRDVDIVKNESVTIKGKRTQNVSKDDMIEVGKKLQINVGDEIVIKTGQASITMKKNGDITIKGKNLTLNGTGKVNVKATRDVIVKGSKISQN
jgi:type VI secretion system secreted protein VgrG